MRAARRAALPIAVLTLLVVLAGCAAVFADGARAARSIHPFRIDNWHESGATTYQVFPYSDIYWRDEGFDLVAAKGVARYGATYLFRHYGEDRSINAVPFKFPLPPELGKPPQRSGALTSVLKPSDYARFLGVVEIGSPRPDIWALYTKQNDDATVYWREHTERYNVEHSFKWPGISIGGTSMTPSKLFSFDAGNWDRYVGRVASFAGKLAFVGKTAVWNDCLYAVTVDPQEPAAARVWSARTGAEIVDVDAVAVSHADKESLAVGVLTGHKEACPDLYRAFGRWSSVRSSLRLLSPDLLPAAELALPVEDYDDTARQYLNEVYGPRAIRLVQGGIDGSSPLTSLDNLQVFYQNGGLRNGGFIANILSRIEVNLSTNALSGIGKDWLGDKTEWKKGLTLAEVNFQVFPVLSDRPDLRNGSYTGLGQYVYVDSMKNAGTGSPDGVVSAFRSDTLVPVKTESAEGQTLDYPVKMEMSNDPATWDLLGVIYGPPPFSLQGSGFEELKKGSSISFKNSSGEKSKLSIKAGGSVRLSEEFFGIGCSAEFGIDYATTKEKSTEADAEFSFKHEDAAQDVYGYFIVNRPNYEVQRYTRKTWAGTDIPGSAIFVTNCTDKAGDATLSFYPFNMTDPDSSVVSKGMRKHPRSTDYSAVSWKADPMGGAGKDWSQISRALLTADTRGGETRTSVTKGQESGQSLEVTTKHKAKWAFVKASFSFGVATDSSLSQAKNTEAVLALDVPKKGAAGAVAQRLEVETYWMQADSTNAYWIPEAFRSNGNYQKPWCIDYRVRGWEPYKASAESVAALGSFLDVCTVGVVAGPPEGGQVAFATPLGASGEAAEVAVGETVTITAAPNDGYRFTGWSAQGDQLQIADPTSATTSLSVSDGGGATAVAGFEAVFPATFSVDRRGADRCDIVVAGADLPAQLDVEGVSPDTMAVGVNLGENDLACPADAWQQDGQVFTCSYRPSEWSGADSGLTLVLDRTADVWSLTATRAEDMGDFMLDCAAGAASLSLSAGGETLGFEQLPVTSSARLRQVGSATSKGATQGRLDLTRAKVTVKAPKAAGKTEFLLSGVRMRPRLFDRRGFTVELNGYDIRLGRFVGRGGVQRYRGRTLTGARVSCEYTSGRLLSLRLSGRFAKPLLQDLAARNLTLRVANRRHAGWGNMIVAVGALDVKP